MKMQQRDEGLDLLKQALSSTGKLKMRRCDPYPDRMAFYVVITSAEKEIDNVLTFEFLSDLSNTAEFQSALKSYVRYTSKRMENVSPLIFYCQSGVPVWVEITWPVEQIPGRAAGFVHVSVEDLRKDSMVAVCAVIITHQQSTFELKGDPFLREVAIINTIRRAVDERKLSFFPKGSHPDNLQELRLNTQLKSESKDRSIDSFIAGKVYWLGFKQGDKKTKVWIADEWDADYLGTDTATLIQTAQVLEVQKMIVLDSTGEFASAGDSLLIRAKEFEGGSSLAVNVGDSIRDTERTGQKWDCFIAHASEDKDGFVRPLAERLRDVGLRIWYDEFTLTVGDSLRRSIDRGLAQSRFGIVVLSPNFFAKHWPQRELDGLVAKETGQDKVVLPVWHNITYDDVCRHSPTLADRVAAKSTDGLEVVVNEILNVIKKSFEGLKQMGPKLNKAVSPADSSSASLANSRQVIREQLSKAIHFRVRIRPIAKRFSNNLEIELIDDDWIIGAVDESKGVKIRNLRTDHFATLGFDQILEFMTDPSRDRGDMKHGFLQLKVQIMLRGIRLETEPLPR